MMILQVACGDADEASAPRPAVNAPAPTTSPTTSAPVSSAPDTVVIDARQRRLDGSRERYGAPGALALVRRDGDEWFGSSGAADTAGTPITRGSRFRIASITKPIIAALMVDAVERGEVGLDDIVSDIVPDVLRPEPPITVRMLLDHTSGIFDVGNEGDPMADIDALTSPELREEAAALVAAYEAGDAPIASARLFVALAETHDRYFDPGAGYHYSNANYQLAGMVLEAVTDMSVSELVAARLAAPFGLESTTVAPPDLLSPDVRGYGTSIDDGSLVDLTDDLVAFGNGASGGIVSTADELLTIMQAIAAGAIVDRPLLTEMTTPTELSGESYGLGIATYYLSCGEFLGHEGGVNGTASIAVVSPDGEDGVVIAMNLRSGTGLNLPLLADLMLCGKR